MAQTHIGRGCFLGFDYTLVSFSRQFQLVLFHRNLRDSKCPQVSKTFLSILADLSALIWILLLLLLSLQVLGPVVGLHRNSKDNRVFRVTTSMKHVTVIAFLKTQFTDRFVRENSADV